MNFETSSCVPSVILLQPENSAMNAEYKMEWGGNNM